MKKYIIKIISFTLLLLTCSLTYAATINTFTSYITVEPSSNLKVQEQINITTDPTIQHGIYRDFPTIYKTSDNKLVYINFNVLSAELNNKPIPYHLQNLSNGVRVYLGSKDQFLPVGTYNFTLTYSVDNELGFFKDHDELYWNVTGNGWAYDIGKATAVVQLPNGAGQNLQDYTAYTGFEGQRGTDYQSYLTDDKRIVFETTKNLTPTQGLTIVVGWKKGFVTPPKASQDFFQHPNNLVFLTLIIGIIISFIFYYLILSKYTGAKVANVVVPEYLPPEGFTPEALRYILEMGYDNKVLTAAILNLAVNGFLKIEESSGLLKKKYTLIKQPNFSGTLPAHEAIIAQLLFKLGNSVELKRQLFLEELPLALQAQLQIDLAQKYIQKHTRSIFGSFFLTSLTVLITSFINPKLSTIALHLPIFLLLSYGSRKVSSVVSLKKLHIVLMLTFVTVVAFYSLYAITQPIFNDQIYYYLILMFVLICGNVFFMLLLKRPTEAGKKLINHINGFKLFLNATEKDRMNFRNPPNRTPELFEKYLPFALALGIEQKWAEQFSDILSSTNYQPTWYNAAAAASFNPILFTSDLNNSFAYAVIAASSPPGSNSGFGGGGGSGGGGGGGGGGGW